MLLDSRTDPVRTLRVQPDGRITEEDPLLLRNTLFAHAHGPESAALVRLPVPSGTHFDALAERLKLLHAVTGGIRGFNVLGAGHGLREGRLFAATPQVTDEVHRRFATAEDALAYGGLLFSEATHVLQLDAAAITDRGPSDGQGWIDPDVLREHGLPVRQIQIRALFDGALAKGTLLPEPGLRERTGSDVLLHTTQLKGCGKDVSGSFLLAIRDTADVRSMRSSWTWTQFLDEDIQSALFELHARPALAAVERALSSNDSALAFLGEIQVHGHEEAERRDLLSSYLAAGLSPRHPWVHRRLMDLVRRTYLDAALGLGPVPLISGMACHVDDGRCRHEVTCNDLPEGEVTILRYPVRDADSLRLVRNVHSQLVPHGSIAVHADLLAKLDGDVDGDWVALCSDPIVARGVRRVHRRGLPRLPIPPRTRKRSPISALPRVAVDRIGASGIGTPTWLVAACVDGDRRDLVPRLSLELQVATMGLKWNVERDYDVLREASGAAELPAWLEHQRDREVFSVKAPRVPGVGLGRFWNICSTHFKENALPSAGTLGDFLDVVPLPTGDADVLAEVETVRQSFHRRVARSDGDVCEIRSAIEAVRSWAAGKTDDQRIEFARSAWYLTHRSQSTRSTGSFAIHSFPDALVREIQDTSGYRAPVLRHDGPEVVEGRSCTRASVDVESPVVGDPTPSTSLRLIGGWRILKDTYEVTEQEALTHLSAAIAATCSEPTEIALSWVDAPWNGHRVLRASLGDDPLGYVPQESAEQFGEDLTGTHRAFLMLRGKTVHATLLA